MSCLMALPERDSLYSCLEPILLESRILRSTIMNETQSTQSEFLDHYYTLGIAVNSNGEIVEETYWRIMRAAKAGKSSASLRPRDVDDLNEAYRVLTTPQLRRAYDAERAEILGPGAEPQAPQPEAPEPPLRVMEKHLSALQREAARDEVVPDTRKFSVRWVPLIGAFSGIAAVASFVIIRFLV